MVRPRALARRLLLPGLLGLTLSACALVLVPDSPAPLAAPAADGSPYLSAHDEAFTAVEPWLHAPWRATPAWPLVWLFGGGVAGVSIALARRWGAGRGTAWLVAVHLFALGSFAAYVRHAADAAFAIAGVWLAWYLATAAQSASRRNAAMGAAGASLFAAIAASWLAVLATPLLIAAWCARVATRRGRLIGAIILLLVALAGVGAYTWRVTALAQAHSVTAVPLSLADTWEALLSPPARPGGVRFAVPEGAAPSPVIAVLVLAALLAGASPRWWRWGVLACVVALAALCLGLPEWRPAAVRWAAWMFSPVAAVGLAWVLAARTPRWRLIAQSGLGVLVLGADVAGSFRAPRSPDALPSASSLLAVANAMQQTDRDVRVVAENSVLDSALVAAGTVPRLAPRADAVSEARASGAAVLAGPFARAQLQLSGFHFETLDPPQGLGTPRVSRVSGELRCAVIRNDRWSLLPGLEYTGRLGIDIPPATGGSLDLIIGDDLPLQVRASQPNGTPLNLRPQPLLSGPGTAAPPPDYWLEGGDPFIAPPRVQRLAIPARPFERWLASVHLGRRAPRVLARLEGHDAAARGRICAAPLDREPLWGRADRHPVSLPLDESDLFGVGWYGLERQGAAGFRWMAEDAALLIPSASVTAVRVELDAAPAADAREDGPFLTLTANGRAEPPVLMRRGVTRYVWTIPARWWLEGTNELLFSLSRSTRPANDGAGDTRVLGLRMHAVRLTPLGEESTPAHPR